MKCIDINSKLQLYDYKAAVCKRDKHIQILSNVSQGQNLLMNFFFNNSVN